MSARAPLALALLLAAAALAPAPARAGIEECEAIANALAYNQCLARFGPARGARAARGTPVPEGADEPKGAQVRGARTRGARAPEAGAGRRGRAGPAAVVVGRGGRRALVLDVAPSARERAAPARPGKRAWRRRR